MVSKETLLLDESTIRERLMRHWQFEGVDYDKSHEIYHEDAVLDFPQSGERFVGRENELGPNAPGVQVAPAWHRQPGFIEAVAERVRDGLDSLPDGAMVLVTAHSLPRRVADAEPGYLDQLRETAQTVATAAGLRDDRWQFCWQSAGHEPGEWMKPDFTDLLPQLREAGHRAVLVAPIQFVADHLEILYDIDIAARQQAEAAGMAFARIESLNVSPTSSARWPRSHVRRPSSGPDSQNAPTSGAGSTSFAAMHGSGPAGRRCAGVLQHAPLMEVAGEEDPSLVQSSDSPWHSIEYVSRIKGPNPEVSDRR